METSPFNFSFMRKSRQTSFWFCIAILAVFIYVLYFGFNMSEIKQDPLQSTKSESCNCVYGTNNVVNKSDSLSLKQEPSEQDTIKVPSNNLAYYSNDMAPFDSMTYSNSEPTNEYYKIFADKIHSLDSSMPLGWRSKQPLEKNHTVFGEFDRYSISKSAMKASEAQKVFFRTGQLSENYNSKKIGQRSLLREYITPLNTIALGKGSKLFNDSSLRQHHIANITGEFPELSDHC